MKIALTRITENTHHLNYSILMKRTCQTKTVKLVPVFAARWRAICKYFINSENKQPEKRYKIQQQNIKNATRHYSRGKKFSPTKSKPLLFSFLLQQTSICTIRTRAAKRTENASCNFMKLSSLSDESTY
jgi:hypothetical protein